MRQKYFDVPFGLSGDVTAIPDALQSGGSVSFTEGWNYNYQRNLLTDPAALPIDRSTMNWLFLQITTALQALQQTALPEYITAANNNGTAFAYAVGAEVLYSSAGTPPFQKFVNLTANNTQAPSASDPTGATTGWQLTTDAIATVAQASAGTDNSTVMTPARVAQQDALRALLAGSISQVFNVGTAVSGTQAPQVQQLTGNIIAYTQFTSTGTWTPNSKTKFVLIRMWGGGGAGGGANAGGSGASCWGGGGGAGGYLEIFMAVPAAQTVTIGAAGAGAAGANGGTGGNTTLTPLNLQASGGTGGNVGAAISTVANSGAGGNGGQAIGSGALLIQGQGGGQGFAFATSAGMSGYGGSSSVGGGAPPAYTNGTASNAGTNANGRASGGSGAISVNTNANVAGGNGTPGLVLITEYGTVV